MERTVQYPTVIQGGMGIAVSSWQLAKQVAIAGELGVISGTAIVSVVTPPLAFAASALFITMVLDGFRPSRVGIDFIAALASEAPFLMLAAAYGWFVYLNQKAKSKPSKRKSAAD